MGVKFPFGMMKCSKISGYGMLHKSVDIVKPLNCTLYKDEFNEI